MIFRCIIAGTCAYAKDNNDGLTTATRKSEDTTTKRDRSREHRSPGGFCAPPVHGFRFSMGCRFCCSADSGPVAK